MGKSLITDVIAETVSGRPMPRKSYPEREEEMEKVLGSYALKGSAFFCLDNVATTFGGPSLDAVLTAPDTVELRILGRTLLIALTWRAVLFATGNNFGLQGDTSDRILRSRMETALENPRVRTGFKIPKLRDYAHRHRAQLVTALLTILRGFIVARITRKEMNTPIWGSFEAWSELIPPAIVYAGGPDVMKTRILDEAEVNEELGSVSAVIDAWPALLRAWNASEKEAWQKRKKKDKKAPKPEKRGWLSAKEAITFLYDGIESDFDALRGALDALCCPRQKSGDVRPTPQVLNTRLMKYKGRTLSGKKLCFFRDSHSKERFWSVEIVK